MSFAAAPKGDQGTQGPQGLPTGYATLSENTFSGDQTINGLIITERVLDGVHQIGATQNGMIMGPIQLDGEIDVADGGIMEILGSTEVPPFPKYKVFTALLTQSGGVNEVLEIDGDGAPLIKGVTYYIGINPLNADLTIYGAPNNLPGTYFIANQNVAALPYTYDLQLFYNEAVPVATVLENTIGNVWFTYETVGSYTINSLGLFTDNKTFELINTLLAFNSNIVGIKKINDNVLRITTGEQNYNSPLDDVLNNTPIEIRVYN